MYGTRTVPPQNLAYQKCNRVSRSKAFMWIKGENICGSGSGIPGVGYSLLRCTLILLTRSSPFCWRNPKKTGYLVS